MARREFPALGFDPAPGNPAAVAAAAGGVDSAGRLFADAAANVARLNSSGWTGEAAEAFRGQLADLPRDLDLAARSHQTAARALSGYGSALGPRQRRADELESRAAELRRAAAGRRSARSTGSRRSGRRRAARSWRRLRTAYDSARSRAEGLGADLDAVLADARRLLDEHRGAASGAARAVRDVADAPYEEPGWLSRAWDSVKSWISDHADVLRQISSVLKGVSAVLGVLSFVPGLQFLAPFAVAAGAIALVIDGALCLAGEGDWGAFALDAALTILPIGPVARAVKRIPGVSTALKGVNRAIPDAVKGRLFRAVGNLPEGVSAGQLDDAARRIRTQVGDLGDDLIVQGSRAGHSARPTSDIDFGLRVDPDRFDDLVRERFGTPNPGSAKERTMLHAIETGKIQAGEAGMRALRRALEADLERAVDLSVIRRGGPFDNEPWLPVQ